MQGTTEVHHGSLRATQRERLHVIVAEHVFLMFCPSTRKQSIFDHPLAFINYAGGTDTVTRNRLGPSGTVCRQILVHFLEVEQDMGTWALFSLVYYTPGSEFCRPFPSDCRLLVLADGLFSFRATRLACSGLRSRRCVRQNALLDFLQVNAHFLRLGCSTMLPRKIEVYLAAQRGHLSEHVFQDLRTATSPLSLPNAFVASNSSSNGSVRHVFPVESRRHGTALWVPALGSMVEGQFPSDSMRT